ncbi:hypothetical protein OJAV_G00194150 [Oryzias javanicus]|uniref:Uncharacterized protein n=1 Tax=Oryzias javanicus TaxID=123683 RepID=A0A437CB26_ORYJA|nr:hypothetical protein OJAV_G00194150 [Oryzias javanicus]
MLHQLELERRCWDVWNQSRGPESRKPTRMDRLRPDLLQLQQTPKMWRLSQEDEDLRPSFNTSASPVAVPQTTTGGRFSSCLVQKFHQDCRLPVQSPRLPLTPRSEI